MTTSKRTSLRTLGAAATILLALACSGTDGDTTAPTVTSAPDVGASTTVPPDDPAVSTVPPTTTPPTTTPPASTEPVPDTTAPETMPPLPAGKPVAFSLPPTFAAAGVDVPVVVSVDADVDAVEVVVRDASGTVLADLAPLSPQFWFGSIPGASVAGSELSVSPAARNADGTSVDGDPVSIVVMARNGETLERREVVAETTVVYDRPWSSEPGELDHVPAEGDGVSINPPGLARVDDDEIAVLDIAAQRVTCYDLAGESTCTVPLPIDAGGDMFPLGDGTLAAIDLGNRDGQQELHVLRIEPHDELVDVIYHEFPLQVADYPGIAVNIGLTWDRSSRTAWVSVPESGPPSAADPDPGRFPYTDALHVDPDGVTRGPTVQRPALRPDIVFTDPTSFRLLDGNTWVTFYDTPVPYYDLEGLDVTESGVIWMLVGIGSPGGDAVTMELVRWRPGAAHFEAFPIELGAGESWTRRIAALDDHTLAVLDTNVGGRVRAFTFPPLDAN